VYFLLGRVSRWFRIQEWFKVDHHPHIFLSDFAVFFIVGPSSGVSNCYFHPWDFHCRFFLASISSVVNFEWKGLGSHWNRMDVGPNYSKENSVLVLKNCVSDVQSLNWSFLSIFRIFSLDFWVCILPFIPSVCEFYLIVRNPFRYSVPYPRLTFFTGKLGIFYIRLFFLSGSPEKAIHMLWKSILHLCCVVLSGVATLLLIECW
jgi:hypothetical protein